ncbi:hypothetical protein AB0M38_09400 [Streptomyces sp. NPDC051742]|uniref:hypothetical protein n=1 Tax=unclassified Streptomyces TaxID=2593676 RepID=UPI00342531C7
MSHHGRRHNSDREHSHEPPPRTTPSHAEGESGDTEARRQAEEATLDRSKAAMEDEDGSTAKRQGSGLGREEQRKPYPRGRDGDG